MKAGDSVSENLHMGPLIKLLNKEFEQLHSERAKGMGLTPAQLFVLHYISVHQGKSICHRDIEKKFELSHATVSGIIARLEAKGFIQCFYSEDDRRYKNILLTEKAKCCENEMKKHIDHYENQLMEGFSEEEKRLLHSFVMIMIHNVNVNLPETGYGEEEK